MIYAGQGVHYAKAWPQLRRLAERLAIPVTTSLGGKSSFPETHPLSLGSGGLAVPRAVPKFLGEADVIFGIGCSFTETSFGIAMGASREGIVASPNRSARVVPGLGYLLTDCPMCSLT